MNFEETIGRVGLAVDALGVAVMVAGLAITLMLYLFRLAKQRRESHFPYRQARVSAAVNSSGA